MLYIHLIWIQGYRNLKKEFKENVKLLKKLNKNAKVKVWSDNEIAELLKKHYPKIYKLYSNVSNLSGNENELATRADIGRFVILYHYGGFYMDVDIVCKYSIEEILKLNHVENRRDAIYAASSHSLINYGKNIVSKRKIRGTSAQFIGFNNKKNPLLQKIITKLESPKITDKAQINHLWSNAIRKYQQLSNKSHKYNVYYLSDETFNAHYCPNIAKYYCNNPVDSSWNIYRHIGNKFCKVKSYSDILKQTQKITRKRAHKRRTKSSRIRRTRRYRK